jgi:hypothetical protein
MTYLARNTVKDSCIGRFLWEWDIKVRGKNSSVKKEQLAMKTRFFWKKDAEQRKRPC